ncbi:hypothetical protein M011DRAFT_465564, partial [Sporormia fimetaria CBS 119925]
MQFSVVSVVAALAAVASATTGYNTTSVGYYPTATGTGGAPGPSSTDLVPFPGAASKSVAGSALAMIVAGGVALM